MSDAVAMSLAAWTGLVLGGFFYGGLWWTVRRTATFRHPGLCVLASLLLRMAVTLTAFGFIAQGHWQRLILCLFGFIVARVAVARLTRSGAPAPAPEEAGLRHAP